MQALQLKYILQIQKPSIHLRYMAEHNQLDHQITNLIGIPQDVLHHPEGDAFTHTLMVVDEAAIISRRESLSPRQHAILLLAALTHDFGKATHTQIHPDGRITSYGHAEASVPLVETFLLDNSVHPSIIAEILPLVNLHMAWVGFYMNDITSKSVRKLLRNLAPSNLQMLAYVVEADMNGRGTSNKGLPQRMKDIITVANTLNNVVDVYPDHLVSGDDIMQVTGIEPSPLLGKVKAALYRAQLEGRFTTREEGILFLLHNVIIAEK